MQKKHGFSFLEVLISLMLVTSISLLLLKQQWQNNRLFNSVLIKAINIIRFANDYELRQRGFALHELLMSLFLSAILVGYLTEHYLQIMRAAKIVQVKIDGTMDLQLVTELLRTSIANAGFTPCGALNNLIVVDNRASNSSNILGLKVENNILYTARMGDNFVTSENFSNQQLLKLPARINVAPKHTLIISDCYHAELQNASLIQKNGSRQLVSLQRKLAFKYIPPVYIGEYWEEIFFIKKKSMYYKFHHTEEISPYVTNMSVFVQGNLVNLNLDITDFGKLSIVSRAKLL